LLFSLLQTIASTVYIPVLTLMHFVKPGISAGCRFLSAREEEIVSISPVLVSKLRDRLLKYFSDLADISIQESRTNSHHVIHGSKGSVRDPSWFPSKIVVVDGGSSVIPLNIGYLGLCAAVAVHISGNRVAERLVADPIFIPEDPVDIVVYETMDQIMGVVDKVREALVFELAKEALERFNPELLIIDGPLIPYSALAKRVVGTRDEEDALNKYRGAVVELLKASANRGVNVIGFVKRPKSMFLYRLGIINKMIYDHIYLSRHLKPGEHYPGIPLKLPATQQLFHDEQIRKLMEAISPSFTFMRFNMQTPPYRIDFGPLNVSFHDILSCLYATRTREGIPYSIMKADEETKFSRKLIKELYEDVLHHYISKLISSGVKPDIIPVLPQYGGW